MPRTSISELTKKQKAQEANNVAKKIRELIRKKGGIK